MGILSRRAFVRLSRLALNAGNFDFGEGLAVSDALLVTDLGLVLYDRDLFGTSVFHDFTFYGVFKGGFTDLYLGAVFLGAEECFELHGVTGFSRQGFNLKHIVFFDEILLSASLNGCDHSAERIRDNGFFVKSSRFFGLEVEEVQVSRANEQRHDCKRNGRFHVLQEANFVPFFFGHATYDDVR